MAVGDPRKYTYLLFYALFLTTLVSLGIIIFSSTLTFRIVGVHAPQMEAVKEMKFQVVESHLWIEEYLHGDVHESETAIFKQLDRALWLAKALLDGASDSTGQYEPIKCVKNRKIVDKVITHIHSLRLITRQRLQAKAHSGSGSPLDEKHDDFYRHLMPPILQLEKHIKDQTSKELNIYYMLKSIFIVLFVLTTGFLLYSFFRHIKKTSESLRELEEAKVKAEKEIKILEGVLPICSHCKKIRSEAGEWKELEDYISQNSEADFSHGVCKECLVRHYSDYIDKPSNSC